MLLILPPASHATRMWPVFAANTSTSPVAFGTRTVHILARANEEPPVAAAVLHE